MHQTYIEETLYAQMHEQYLKNDSDKTKTIILFCIATIHLDFSLRNLDANVKIIFDEAGITIWPFIIAGCILALTINMIVYGRYYHKYKKEKNKHHEKK